MIFKHQGHTFKSSLSWCEMTQCIYDEHNNFITEIPYSRDWYEVAQVALTAHLKTQLRKAA